MIASCVARGAGVAVLDGVDVAAALALGDGDAATLGVGHGVVATNGVNTLPEGVAVDPGDRVPDGRLAPRPHAATTASPATAVTTIADLRIAIV